MHCANCGNKIEDLGEFCSQCGVSLAKQRTGVKNNKPDILHQTPEVEGKQLNHHIKVGLVWLIGGIIVTWVTYSSTEPGGTYFLFWGPMLYGGYRIWRGLFGE